MNETQRKPGHTHNRPQQTAQTGQSGPERSIISGWLRRWLPGDAGGEATGRTAITQYANVALANRLLQRHQDRPMAVTAGKPAPVSLTPAAIAYFTEPIVTRAETFNRRRESRPLKIKAAPGTELLLSNNVKLAETDTGGWASDDEARKPTFQQMLAMINRPAFAAATAPSTQKAAAEVQPSPELTSPAARPSPSRSGRGRRIVRRPPASYVQELSPGEPPPKTVEQGEQQPTSQPAKPARKAQAVQTQPDDPAGAPPSSPPEPASPPPVKVRSDQSEIAQKAVASGPEAEESSTFRKLMDKISRAAVSSDLSASQQPLSEAQSPPESARPAPPEFRPAKPIKDTESSPRPNPGSKSATPIESTPPAETFPPPESRSEGRELSDPPSSPAPQAEVSTRPERGPAPDRAPPARPASPARPENDRPLDWTAPPRPAAETTTKPEREPERERFEEAASLEPSPLQSQLPSPRSPLLTRPPLEPVEPTPLLRRREAEPPHPDQIAPTVSQKADDERTFLSETAVEARSSTTVDTTPGPSPAKKSTRPRPSREPASFDQSSQQAGPLDLAGEIAARTARRTKLPVTTPGLPLNVVTSLQPPVTTTEQATNRLMAQGWRFKRKSGDSSAASSSSAQTAARLEQNTEPGKPLVPKPRSIMENIMGRDFGGVRIHTLPLTGLNVQAAAKERDVYVEPGQDRFDTPDSMALLGHELTHVAQQGFAKPVVQTAILPQAQTPGRLGHEEAEAERNEQITLDYFRPARPERDAAGGPAMSFMKPDLVSSGEISKQPSPISRQSASNDFPFVSRKTAGSDEIIQRDPLDADMIETEEKIEDMPEPDELEPKEPDLKKLARKIYPLIKRRLAIERQQMPR